MFKIWPNKLTMLRHQHSPTLTGSIFPFENKIEIEYMNRQADNNKASLFNNPQGLRFHFEHKRHTEWTQQAEKLYGFQIHYYSQDRYFISKTNRFSSFDRTSWPNRWFHFLNSYWIDLLLEKLTDIHIMTRQAEQN